VNSALVTLPASAIISRAAERKAACGIYFLILNDAVVYVGQSRDCHARLREHERDGKKFDKFHIIEAYPRDLNRLEAHYIRKLSPPLNVQRIEGVGASINTADLPIEDGIEPLAVKIDTAARILDCSRSTVYKLLNAGKLKTINIGADQRIPVESIKEFLRSQE
jgi:excisionase family DNA binding protein